MEPDTALLILARAGLPAALLRHLLDSGHFAVEDSLEEIVAHIERFHAERVVEPGSPRAAAVAESTR